MFLSVKEAVSLYIEQSKKKAASSTKHIIGKSILAGIMIGMGAAASSVAAHSITNVGVSRLAAAVVFPVGLMMVILLGAELFTGDCLMAMAIPEKKISIKECIRVLVYVFLGNMIGATLLAFMIFRSGQLDYSNGLLGAYTIKVALGKASITGEKAIVSGILCNILVCAAVLMAACAKDITGKLLTSFFVIMLFVTAGFEHCVANMYYITAGLFAKLNPTYVSIAMQEYGIDQSKLELLNIKNYFISNLVPVTLGNIIGGIIFIGLPLYYLNNKNSKNKKIDVFIDEKEAISGEQLYPDYVASVSR